MPAERLQFQLKPLAYGSPGGILFDVLGQESTGTVPAYHFLVQPNGSMDYYNGTAWLSLPSAPAGTVSSNAWNTICVEATAASNNAALYVNGVWRGNATMYANPSNVLALNGVAFSSSGTAYTGDQALFDDVSVSELAPLQINGTALSGTNLVLTGINGVAGGAYRVLGTSIPSSPLANWQVLATNSFDIMGGGIWTNAATGGAAQFYRLLEP